MINENFHPFKDMRESAKAQHKEDKACFQATKIESKVNFEAAKLAPYEVKALDKIFPFSTSDDSNERIEAANARLAGIQQILNSRN